MAYPIATLADGSTKMSDGTIQPKDGPVAPQKFNLFDFKTPATSSGASFVNRQNSIAENIIGPSVTDTLRNKTAVSAPLPKENVPMFSEQSKRSLWKAEGLDESGFDVNAFDKNGPGMYIKQEYIDRYKTPEQPAQGMPGIDTANAGQLTQEDNDMIDQAIDKGFTEEEAFGLLYDFKNQNKELYQKEPAKEDTNYFQKFGEAAMAGASRIGEAVQGASTGKYALDEALMRGAAGGFETVFSPLTAGIGELAEEVVVPVAKYAGSKAYSLLPQAGKDKVNEFAKYAKEQGGVAQSKAKEFWESQSPEQKRRLENIGVGVEMLLNVVGGGQVKKVLPKAGELAESAVKSGVKATEKTLQKGAGKIDDVYTRSMAGISKGEKAGLQANPYQAEEFGNMVKRSESPQGIDNIANYKTERHTQIQQDLTDTLDTMKKSKSESGEVYDEVRKLTNPVPANPLLADFENTLRKNGVAVVDGQIVRMEGTAAGEINQADIAKFNQLYRDILADANKQAGNITPKQALKARETASNMAKYDAATTTKGQSVIRELRKHIDKSAKDNIPGLKELDKNFADKLNELEQGIKDLVYKGGDVKGDWRSNIVSIVSNLDKPNRALLLERLEEVLPGIGARVEAVNNLPKLYKAMNDTNVLGKWGGAGGAFAGATAGGAMIPIVGHLLGGVAGFIGGNVAETALGKFRVKAINNILSKTSKEGIENLNKIAKKITEKRLLTEEEAKALKTIKDQVAKEEYRQNTISKTPLLPAPSWKAPFTQQKPIILPKSVTETKLGKTDIGKAKIGTTDRWDYRKNEG